MKKILLIILLCTISLNARYVIEDEFKEKVYVRTYGDSSNDTIILVHGMGDEASSLYEEVIEELRDDYFVLTFDLPGFGKSTKSNQLYSMKRYVKFIHNIKNKYIHKKYHLLGHSMGGAISLKYANEYKDEIKSLIIVDAAGVLTKQSFSQAIIKSNVTGILGSKAKEYGLDVALAKIPSFLEEFIPIDMGKVITNSKVREYLFKSNPTAISALSLVDQDFSNVIKNIKLNTRIIWGEDDPIATVKTGYALHKLIKHSKLSILRNSKHVPFVDNFDEFMINLRDHLENPYYPIAIKQRYKKRKNIIWENVSNRTISGDIDYVELINCKNITIKNAKIKNFGIFESRVNIIHSELNPQNTSYIVNSICENTASKINNKKPIEIYNSTLEFIAVDFNSKNKIFKNLNPQKSNKIQISLSNKYNKTVHGEYKLEKNGTKLYK